MSGGGMERARSLLAGARRVMVLTGAGISAESGVPTFRDEDGLWSRYRPEDLATPGAFRRDPALVWGWYRWRRGLIAACAPNAGHRALAARALAGDVAIVTQNVDGLHDRAAREEAERRGVEAEPALALALHGDLMVDRCTRCGRRSAAVVEGAEAAPGPVPDTPREGSAAVESLPRCDACGGLLRPDVVWFGEALDAEVLARAAAHARSADVCLVVGTSALVHPAAGLPMDTLAAGGAIVEVNPRPTPLSGHAAACLRGPAGAVLPELLATEDD